MHVLSAACVTVVRAADSRTVAPVSAEAGAKGLPTVATAPTMRIDPRSPDFNFEFVLSPLPPLPCFRAKLIIEKNWILFLFSAPVVTQWVTTARVG